MSSSSQCLPVLLIAAILHNWQLTIWRTDRACYPLFSIPIKIAQNTTLFFRTRGSCYVFFPTFCASNRAPDRFFSRATFCASNRASDGSFLVQLFALQIVLQMGLLACNFLCSKSCSRWVFLRAFFFGVRSLENISWFHFAWCSPSVIACNDCKSKYFFSQAALFSSSLNKQKKVCCTCCMLYLLFLLIFSCYFLSCNLCPRLQAIGLSHFLYKLLN